MNNLIILLLVMLIVIYMFDVYKKEIHEGFSSYFEVDYNTRTQACDDLTGSRPCEVKTVVPSKEIVCNKKLDIIDKSDDLFSSKSNRSARSTVRRGMKCTEDNKAQCDSLDMGMSMDELDLLSNEQGSMQNMNLGLMRNQILNGNFQSEDDVSYEDNKQNNMYNKKITKLISQDYDTSQIENNTLSDVDEELY